MALQASKKCGLLPHHHHRLASCRSNGVNSVQVPGTFSDSGALNFTLTNRRWKMKRFCGYFFVSGLMLGSLLLQYDPVSALDSTMAHHDKGSGTSSPSGCVSDMVDPTTLKVPGPQTFKLCVFNSGATSWAAEIRKEVIGYPLVSGCQMNQVAVSTQSSFTCNVSTTGNYRGIIYYWVGATQFTHIDRKFVR